MKHLSFLLLMLFFGFSFAKLPIAETPFTDYTFNAAECKLLQHQKTRIFVPSYSFYLDGKIYEGEVLLKYREFVDQLDIIINNIPMNYTENDKKHVLESGGMFEILAYGNGKLLSFAPTKKIQVQLATQFDITGGETFIFNRQNNTWKKDTPFGATKEANSVVNFDTENLWGDKLWYDTQFRDEIYNLAGDSIMRVQSVNNSTSFEELQDQAFKTLNVDKMEMYNVDKILNEETIPIVADFKLDGIDKKLNSQIYVVYKNRNAVLSYLPQQNGTEIMLLPNEDYTIFSFSQNGKIAVLDNAFMNTFNLKENRNKKVTFPLKVYKNNPTTKEALAQITGL